MSSQTRITIQEYERHNFKKLYDFLFIEPYIHMSNDSKILYTLLRDRFRLSKKNGWINAKGEIFLIYKNKDLMEMMQRSEPSIIKMKKELTKYNLLEEEKQQAKNNANLPNLLFLKAESEYIIEDKITLKNEDAIKKNESENEYIVDDKFFLDNENSLATYDQKNEELDSFNYNLNYTKKHSGNNTEPYQNNLSTPTKNSLVPPLNNLSTLLKNFKPSKSNISKSNINNTKCLISIKYLANEELNELFINYLNMRYELYANIEDELDRKKYYTDENQILSLLKRLDNLSKGSEFLMKKIILASLKNKWANFFDPNFYQQN